MLGIVISLLSCTFIYFRIKLNSLTLQGRDVRLLLQCGPNPDSDSEWAESVKLHDECLWWFLVIQVIVVWVSWRWFTSQMRGESSSRSSLDYTINVYNYRKGSGSSLPRWSWNYIFVNSEKMSCVLNVKIIILYSKYGKTRNFMSFKCLSIT